MSWLAEIDPRPVFVFVMVLARVSGLVATAPFFGMSSAPVQVRALIAVALSLLITPIQIARAPEAPMNVVDLGLILAGELFLGMMLGLGVQFFFSGIQLAGQLISQTSGMTLADVLNPDLNEDIPLFANFLHTFALVLFLALGGHRLLLAGLLDTFEAAPMATLSATPAMGEMLLALIQESFSLSLRVAAPCVASLLLATLVMGLVSRTLPQLNIMSFGFGVNALVTLGTLTVSLSAVLWILEDELSPLVQSLVEAVQGAV